MFGLGKKRSKYGMFLDNNGIQQEEVCEVCGLNRETVTKACREDEPKFRKITKEALVEAARGLSGKNVSQQDFWS